MNLHTPATLKQQLSKFPAKADAGSSKPDTEVSKPRRKSEKPFVRKPHLTHRPLRDNEALAKLKDSLPQNRKTKHNSNPNRKRKPRPESKETN